MKQLLLLFVFMALAFSCGKKEEKKSSSTVKNGMTNAYSGIAGQTAKLSDLAPNSSKSTEAFSEKAIMATAFGTKWSTDTNVMPNNTTDANDTTSIKEWMGHQIDESSVRENGSSISILGRLKGALGLFCALGVALGTDVDGDGYPADGSKTVTISSGLVAKIDDQCDMDASDASGQDMTFTVSTPTDTTIYDKKVVLSPPNGGSQTVYFRSTSSAINVGSIETYTLDEDEDSSGQNDDRLSRTTVKYDITNKIIKGEYISGYNEGAIAASQRTETSRILYDESNDEGYIMYKAFTHTDGDIVEYILTGKPQTSGGEFALSFQASDIDANERQACVEASTGNITGSDGTYCTASAGVSLDGISISTATDHLEANYNSNDFDTISETATLSFTSTNFATTEFLTE